MADEKMDKSKAESEENTGSGALAAVLDEMDNFRDIPLTISVELGQAEAKVGDILNFQPGAVVELTKLVGEPMEIYINGLLTARGEVVVVNERFGIRVTDVIDPLEIVRFKTIT